MGSRKPSAKAKRIAEFRDQLASDLDFGTDDAFAREDARQRADEAQRDAARRDRACLSKNRYTCLADAQAAIASCASYGTTGLHPYKCPYCKGWHLTSHPWE